MAGSAHITRRSVRDGSVRLDRHSASGRLGAPKKGGAGTKFVWGVAGVEDDYGSSYLDEMDPNYSDSEEEVYRGKQDAAK